MTVIKQKTVNGQTIKLKRLRNKHPDLSSNKWMYVVEFEDGDRTSPRFVKENAKREFRRVVKQRQTSGSGGLL